MNKRRFYFLLVILSAFSIHLQAQNINTFAGNGTPGFAGDGGAATSAQLNFPAGVAVDAAGNVYISDHNNNRIRKVDISTGVITTICGTGTAGSDGDGGLATAAQIQKPRGIAIDAAGNIFFADFGNNRIRKINTSGIISTVAGIGTVGFSGDGGAATAARLNFPWSVTVDAAGNLYIPDQNNCRVRKVNTSGIISTIAGTGTCAATTDGIAATSSNVQYPLGVALDGAGNMYIADNGNNRIRKVNTSGIISTIAGSATYGFTGDGGPSTAARLYYPRGVWTDAANNIYIADVNNYRFRKINSAGTISTIVGNGTGAFAGDGGPATSASINEATGFAFDAARAKIYIADNNNNRIRVIQLSHDPQFAGGDTQNITICLGTETVDINDNLAINDIDAGQTETWSMVSPPLHGTAVVSYSTTSTGSLVTPTGLTYSPTLGYSGQDSFTVRVNDGALSDTTKIKVYIIPLPAADTITGLVDSLCPFDTTTLTYTGALVGTWGTTNASLATVSSAGLVTGLSVGSVNITYTLTNVCGTSSSFYPLYIGGADCPVNINSPAVASGDVQVYPNPSKGTFTVVLQQPGTQKAVSMILTDATGRKIKEFSVLPNKPAELKYDLPAGIYFISTAGTQQYHTKLVITR